MLDPSTLRGRLTIWYTGALSVALIAFAVFSLITIDSLQRAALDERLATTAAAAASLIDPTHGHVVMDASDRRQFHRVTSGRVAGAVFDDDGRLVIETGSLIPEEIRRAVRRVHSESALSVQGDEEQLRVRLTPLIFYGRQAGTLALWHDDAAIAAIDHRLVTIFAIAIPLVVALAIIAGGVLARRGLAPLNRIVGLASEIEARDLTRRLALPNRNDELGRLAATFDRMLERLQHAFERQRQFTSDASHELRAPLAVIRAEGEVALREQRSAAEYRDALAAMVDEAKALEALTSELLTAARAEHEARPIATAVDMGEVVDDVVQRFLVVARERGVTIKPRIELDATVLAARSELERVAFTIVHNATKYAQRRVDVQVAAVDGAAELQVADDGPGFSPSALERAFDRFWRDDTARNEPGSGLGLTIAKAIVERGGGEIALSNAQTGGAVVRVRLPAHADGALVRS